MAQYLVSIHHPENFDPSSVTEETMRDIGVLNKEMMAAGVRLFAGGLQSETKAEASKQFSASWKSALRKAFATGKAWA